MTRYLCMVSILVCGWGIATINHVAADRSCAAGEKPAGQLVQAADVGVSMRGLIEADWIERDKWFVPGEALAPERTLTEQGEVTTAQDAAGGCDGVKNGRFGFHTASSERDPWWQVDLGQPLRLDRVLIYNRTDGTTTASRTRKIRILVARDADHPQFQCVYEHNGETFYGTKDGKPLLVTLRDKNVTARIVRLHVPGRCSFALDEVEVYSADTPQTNVALGRPADQKSVGPYSCPGTKGVEYVAPKPEPKPEPGNGFLLAHTREVMRHTQELTARLRPNADLTELEPLSAQLARLDSRLTELETLQAVPEETRRGIYLETRWLARRIAFCNPLLDFDRLLFVKRHPAGGLFHMVHQYYGFCARPGGGLFVLSDPFSDKPVLANLLDRSALQSGRLKGQALAPGAFLSPDLSFDGKKVLFAYTEGKAEGIEWSPRSSYHIFQVNADGSELVQLTDGSWNDFDPCYLPNGRIAFISERRGGYLRCGGSAPPYDSPTYTLHSMNGDGGDMVCLSYHETQEWHPSVNNDGMLVYTRWDYIDRDTNVAHHIWTCYPDGRDPRSFHGNYPERRESRPWMEMSIRAIPNSHQYVATAAAHHGHAFGSLVLIDPHVPDDNAMSQLTRLTPDVPFPESEGGKTLVRERMAYATAWPLSEDDFLCAYDAGAKNHGLYWIDRFGNKELIYRDPSIACLSPIPLRPRNSPPALCDRTTQTAKAAGQTEAAGQTKVADQAEHGDRQATVAVVSVYSSDFPWPKDTEITSLRIIQVFPKTTPPSNQPRIGVGNQTNARAVLGTVPVESDGSAYFEVPAGKVVYFQALDDRGLAVQSMRSGTYVHPGEHLTCLGCHEPKHHAPPMPKHVPLALKRAPSRIEPDVDGSNPFNFIRLVQPVLDEKCVSCHRERKALDLTRVVDGEHGWSRSYQNLAGSYGFYFHVNNGSIKSGIHGGSRTLPGRFGARASKLIEYLDERHYGVSLSDKDLHRLTLWLDCNSEFYGAYENTVAQSRGEAIRPSRD